MLVFSSGESGQDDHVARVRSRFLDRHPLLSSTNIFEFSVAVFPLDDLTMTTTPDVCDTSTHEIIDGGNESLPGLCGYADF